MASGLRALHRRTRQRGVALLLSDFRDAELLPPAPDLPRLRAALAPLTRLHDVIAAVVVDRREEELPRVGTVRIEDPERPGATLLLRTTSRRARERYREACAAWRRRLEVELRRSGAETLWLRTDRSPLYALGRFFQERAARRSRVAA